MKRITIPWEIMSRLDDVNYSLPSSNWHKLTSEQQARVKEEAEHLIDLIRDGGNWYDGDGEADARRDLRQAEAFLKRVA